MSGPRGPRGERNGRATVPDEAVARAVAEVRAGVPLAAVARRCGVPRRTLRQWVAGTRRADAASKDSYVLAA